MKEVGMNIEVQDASQEIMSKEIITAIAQLAETSDDTVASCGTVSNLPGWDSLKQIILMATIERTLQIKVPMDAFLATDRLADILDFARTKEPQP
jgi:acyl carrier protein